MNNEVLEKMLHFLNQLRCEQNTRKSAVQIPGLKEREEITERLLGECEQIFEELPEQSRRRIEKWIERKEELGYLQEQKAYCQGYVDCILLLSGLGLLQPEISYDNLTDLLKQ